METLSIRVSIGDRVYPLRVPASEEEYVREAARIINEKSKAFSQAYHVKDNQDTLAMVALEFASELVSAARMEDRDKEASGKLLNSMIQKVDGVLS